MVRVTALQIWNVFASMILIVGFGLQLAGSIHVGYTVASSIILGIGLLIWVVGIAYILMTGINNLKYLAVITIVPFTVFVAVYFEWIVVAGSLVNPALIPEELQAIWTQEYLINLNGILAFVIFPLGLVTMTASVMLGEGYLKAKCRVGEEDKLTWLEKTFVIGGISSVPVQSPQLQAKTSIIEGRDGIRCKCPPNRRDGRSDILNIVGSVLAIGGAGFTMLMLIMSFFMVWGALLFILLLLGEPLTVGTYVISITSMVISIAIIVSSIVALSKIKVARVVTFALTVVNVALLTIAFMLGWNGGILDLFQVGNVLYALIGSIVAVAGGSLQLASTYS